MKAIAALGEGARQSMRLFKVTVLFYLVNLAAAAVIAAPAAVFLAGDLAHSLENARLFANFDPAFAAEIYYNYKAAPFAGVGALAAGVALLFFVTGTFLSGAAIALFRDEKEAFFSAGARYFPRLFRLMLVSLLFYAVVMGINGGIARVIVRLRETSMVAGPWIMAGWFRIALVVFLLGVVNMIFDYAKIVCVAGETRGAWRATFAALRFVGEHKNRTLAVYWIAAAAALAMFAAYHGLSEYATQSTMARVVLVLAFRQVYVLFRIWARMWTWSSELHLYGGNPALPAPAPPAMAMVE